MSDKFNFTLINSEGDVDKINKRFYERYNYPWPPSVFPSYPARMAKLFLNQDIGYWNHDRIPEKPKIWVAGCGTNQALLTALKFPEAEVLGTDISTISLDVCRRNARQMGVENLQLEERSLNSIDYKEAFDYIICTGVVHHNADPQATLGKISAALKRNGILEFMVYNYYHRLLTTACQKAIRTFYDADVSVDLEQELSLARHLMTDFPYDNFLGSFLKSQLSASEEEMADKLLQPVEYSYTVESLGELADSCNLEYLVGCVNQFVAANNNFNWNTQFHHHYLRNIYDSLPDVKRWQISNLLMLDNSPMLWFYLQRKDANHKRKTEREICDAFLETTFSRCSFGIKNYVLDANGDYILEEGNLSPSAPVTNDPVLKRILNAVSNDCKMKEVFQRLNLDLSLHNVNNIRAKLSTSAFPYLLANRC